IEKLERRRVGKGLGLAILSSVLVLPLAFLLALKPTSARAVWEEFARMMELKGPATSAKGSGFEAMSDESLAKLPAQAQAELLFQRTVSNYDAAGTELASRVEGWRGQLTMSPRLAALLDSGLNSNDMRVRASAIEMELAANDLSKTEQSARRLRARI